MMRDNPFDDENDDETETETETETEPTTYDRVGLSEKSLTIQDEESNQWLSADASVDLADAR